MFWQVNRDWYLEWGATDLEVLGAMAGDAEVPDPTYQTTLAISISAPPECIWPWLLQLGYRRGGLYSYDWLDRAFGYLDRPSAGQVLPEFQHLEVGDAIPMGRGPAFPVTAVEPLRALVLSGATDDFRWTWQFELHRVDFRHTRLISRNRARVPRTIGSVLFMLALEPAAFIMTRQMLHGIKRRAESLAARRNQTMRRAA